MPKQRVIEMMAAGMGVPEMVAALGVSQSTVKRWRETCGGEVAQARIEKRAEPPAELQPLPDDGEVPEDTPLAQVNYWLALAQREARAAEANGHTEIMIKMVRLASSLIDAKRRAMPAPKADPNDHPDLIEAAERVRERWATLLTKVASR